MPAARAASRQRHDLHVPLMVSKDRLRLSAFLFSFALYSIELGSLSVPLSDLVSDCHLLVSLVLLRQSAVVVVDEPTEPAVILVRVAAVK